MKQLARLDYWIGVVCPLPVFLDPSSGILLANKGLWEQGFALPISMFLLPLCMMLACVRSRFSLRGSEWLATLSLVAFMLLLMAESVASSFISTVSYLYFFQWIGFILWIPYFATLKEFNSEALFFRGFFAGAFLGASYIFLAGTIEIVRYGALQDLGRMSQNLVLPGQYQLYVYTPTVLALSAIIANWIWRAKIVKVGFLGLIALNVISFTAIIFTGAREGIVLYVVGVALYFSVGNVARTGLVLILGLGSLLTILVGFDAIQDLIADSGLRIIGKFLALSREGGGLGHRDIMVVQYFELIKASPLIGTALLPHELAFPELDLFAPSAHNYYIDALGWLGIVGSIGLFVFLLILLLASFKNIFFTYLKSRPKTQEDSKYHLLIGFSCVVFLVMIISNNINVPMRQPLLAPLLGLAMAYVLFRGRRRTHLHQPLDTARNCRSYCFITRRR